MSEAEQVGVLERVYSHISNISSLGDAFQEGFSFINQMDSLPEENQQAIFAEIAFEVDIPQLALKYSQQFNQKLDKTIFALSYLKIQLEQFKEELQQHYLPVLNPEDGVVWFSPDCDVDAVIKQCLGVGQPGDVLCDLNGIKALQLARGVTLFKKKLNGDRDIREKDISECFEMARKAAMNIADVQLKANLFEQAGTQINIKVQAGFNSLADALPEEQRDVIPEVVGKFLAWVDRREQPVIDVQAVEDAPVKRGRGRPKKYLKPADFA